MKRDDVITVDEAMKAMFLFWQDVYLRTNSDDIGSMLGDLSLLPDGGTADPAAYGEFIDCIKRIKEAEQSGVFSLTLS
jgi:hypothetical protein